MIQDLPTKTPRAYKELEQFYFNIVKNVIPEFSSKPFFLDLPFEMQFGVIAAYLKEEGLDMDIPDWDKNLLNSIIMEKFMVLENMIDHYS